MPVRSFRPHWHQSLICLRYVDVYVELAEYLAAHADRVLTHQAILTQVWGFEDFDHVEYLRVYIGQLRKKIEVNPDEPQFLLTEPGIGYRFKTGE